MVESMTAATFFGVGSATDLDAVVIEVPYESCGNYDRYTLGSVAGQMKVRASGDGVNYLPNFLALIDLCATDPSTAVTVTVAGKHYGFSGKYKIIEVLQSGATAVSGAYMNGYQLGG
jgi:hypothetical protein